MAVAGVVLDLGIEPGIVEHDDAARAHELFGTPETGAARLHGTAVRFVAFAQGPAVDDDDIE